MFGRHIYGDSSHREATTSHRVFTLTPLLLPASYLLQRRPTLLARGLLVVRCVGLGILKVSDSGLKISVYSKNRGPRFQKKAQTIGPNMQVLC